MFRELLLVNALRSTILKKYALPLKNLNCLLSEFYQNSHNPIANWQEKMTENIYFTPIR